MATFNARMVETHGLEVSNVPVDTTGAAQTGDYYSLKRYNHLTIMIIQGAWAGGTPAVTLLQATDVAGTGEKALSFTTRWTMVAITGTAYTETAVTSSTFNLPATANTINILEIEASDLDLANSFDCVRVNVATPGSNADLICIVALLSQPRDERFPMPDAKVN